MPMAAPDRSTKKIHQMGGARPEPTEKTVNSAAPVSRMRTRLSLSARKAIGPARNSPVWMVMTERVDIELSLSAKTSWNWGCSQMAVACSLAMTVNNPNMMSSG
jgi:hypothetical protein